MALLWTGSKIDYDAWMSTRTPLPPIPRIAVPIPVPHAVDSPRFDPAKAQTSARMGDHYNPYPEDDQDAALQRMLDLVDKREGRNCGDVVREAKRRLTRKRLAVLEETIRAWR